MARQQGRFWRILAAALGCVLLLASLPAFAQLKARSDPFGDSMQLVLPAVAVGITLREQDDEGLKQLALTGALSQSTVALLRSQIPSSSPDGSPNSLASHHTSLAFASASYLHMRYGLESAVPAYALAGLTAYSRVNTRQEYSKDAMLGALLGSGFAYFLVHPIGKNTQVAVLPVGGGLRFYLRSRW